MARTVAELPPGARITDYISLGVITKAFPLSTIGAALSSTGKASLRQRSHAGLWSIFAPPHTILLSVPLLFTSACGRGGSDA